MPHRHFVLFHCVAGRSAMTVGYLIIENIMLKNVYLFMWEDRYSLDQEVKRWTSNFLQKFGEDSLFIYNNENRDEMSASQSIFGGGLFSEKKLTVIYGLPLDNAKWNTFKVADIEWFIDGFIKKEWKIPVDNLLVFVSNKPDKRSRFFKFLKDNASVKEFNPPKDTDVKKFIFDRLWDIKIDNDALDLLMIKIGSDLYRVDNEIQKLQYYCVDKKINKIDYRMVEEMVFGLVETEAFWFLRLLFKSKEESMKYLQRMQDQWLNWNVFSWALYRGLKLYITLYHFAKKGIKDSKTIASQTWINPFVLWQNMKYIDIILKNWIEIENMYKKLMEIEVDIKTGKKTEESFRLETIWKIKYFVLYLQIQLL